MKRPLATTVIVTVLWALAALCTSAMAQTQAPATTPAQDNTDKAPKFKVLSSYGYHGLFTDLGYVRGFSTHQTFLYRPVQYIGIGVDLAYGFASAAPLTVPASAVFNPDKEEYVYVPEHSVERAANTFSAGPAFYYLPTVKEKHEFQVGLSFNVAYLGFKDMTDAVLDYQIMRDNNCGFRLLAGAGYQYRFTRTLGMGFRLEYSFFRNNSYALSGLDAYFTLGFEF